MYDHVDGNEFLTVVRPGLESGSADQLAALINDRWTSHQLTELLKHEDPDVRCAAALVVGLIGDRDDAAALAESLHDLDSCVNEMAEHGLWTLWFRCCNEEATAPFSRGLTYLENEKYDEAVDCFEQTIKLDPDFAEAHNQCAIAHYFLGQWRHAITHSIQAVKLMPSHFGAMASAGHCYTQLEQYPMAVTCYKRALNVNPNMPAIAGAILRIEQRLARDRRSSSGEFQTGEIFRSPG